MHGGFVITQEREEVAAAHNFQIHSNLVDVQLLECSARLSDCVESGPDELLLKLEVDSKCLSVVEREARISVSVSVKGQTPQLNRRPLNHPCSGPHAATA